MSLIKSTQKKVAKSAQALTAAMTLKSYRKLAVNFLILTVNLVIIILYFTLSEAKITITPKKELVTHQLQIPLSDVQGQTVQTDLKYSQTFGMGESTGEPAQATGQVMLINTTNHSQTLVATTQLGNQAGTIIRLKDRVELAAGAKITTQAYADQPGPAGEVEPARFQIIKLRDAKDKIYGEVAAKFTGGTVRSKSLTDGAYQKARAEIEEKLKTLTQEKLQTQYPDATAEAITVKINNLASDVKVGEKNKDKFTLSAEATGSLLIYDTAAARDIIKADLAKTIPPNKIVSSFDDKSFTSELDQDGKNLNASITARVQPKLADAVFEKKDIIGLNREEIRAKFAKITGIEGVEVKFSPFWVRSVPNLQDHVDIEIKK